MIKIAAQRPTPIYASALILIAAIIFLLAAPAKSQADHGGQPQIPPSQECIDLMAKEVPLTLSKYLYSQALINASWQKSVDAGCLPHNPAVYWPIEFQPWDVCLQLESETQAYLDSLSSWAAPYWARFRAINRQAQRRLKPLRRAIFSAYNSQKKAKVRRLLSKERRILRSLRRQYINVGRRTISRAAGIQAAGALVISDMQVRGCELYSDFFARQKNYFTITFAAVPLWIQRYRKKITERDWDTWHYLVTYSYWNFQVSMAATKLGNPRVVATDVPALSQPWLGPNFRP